MFLLVPAYPGCPGSKAVKRSLLLLLLLYHRNATEATDDVQRLVFSLTVQEALLVNNVCYILVVEGT